MPFTFSIPSPSGLTSIRVEAGSSVVFVGANGGGKTRLAVHIEEAQGLKAHRIAAHRALALNPSVAKIPEWQALAGLSTGFAATQYPQVAHRHGSRWNDRPATFLLNDFDLLIQALFADQTNKTLKTHSNLRAGDYTQPASTKFEQLVEIWQRLLPHRRLHISGDAIEVEIAGSAARYNASDMSDGERAIFYMIGQTLSASENVLLIFDEPELHVHPAIMAKLWDELEATRQDCAFLFITHDLTFAASRVAQKFVIRDYEPTPAWTVQAVPENTGFDEEITTLILGSRRPILFVEGDENSLDALLYRCCFSEWTVIPRGSCEEVIHSVVTMKRNKELTRVTCAGIVDSDGLFDAKEIKYFKKHGVEVLPVSEVENIILLPDVSRAIAESEGYQGVHLDKLLCTLKQEIFSMVNSGEAREAVVTRYCRQRIDLMLKKINLSKAKNVAEITDDYKRQTSSLDVSQIAQEAHNRICEALRDQDLLKLLANYDNKGMMAIAAKYLKNSNLSDFESWLTRVLRNNKVPALTEAIQSNLPKPHAR